MSFKQKLDSLMKVFGVSNNRLAKALAIDASLVSRWRTGKRVPHPDSPHLKSIASYFTELAKMDYQKTALWEIMGLPLRNYSEKNILGEVLQQWLKDQFAPENVLINNFLEKIVKSENVPVFPLSLPPEKPLTPSHPLRTEILYGLEGKQRGVLAFLETVLQGKELCPLLLYSDESMEWFREDRLFLRRFVSMLYQVIAKGHKVKIIHTISRDMSEMFAAIEFWLPFYITGAIQPYYCPKYREHYFRRTIFVAPGTAALTSSTLHGLERMAPNLFSTDLSFVNSLTHEFYEYLNICRPLMHIFTDAREPLPANILKEFVQQGGDCYRLSHTFSPYTMPEEIIISLLDRSNIKQQYKAEILEQHQLRKTALINNLSVYRYTEIITLPSPAKIKEGAVSAEIPELAAASPLFYTPLEFSRHLENIISLLRENRNYRLFLSPRSIHPQLTLNVKDDTGVVIMKKDPPAAFFTFDQPNMTNAFFCYVEDYVNKLPLKNREKEEVIRILEDLLQELGT